MVTDAQVRRLRQKRMEGKTQAAAAAASGMSVRTARAYRAIRRDMQTSFARCYTIF
jgi:hypothetical protein